MQRQRETGWGFAVCRHREWQGNSGRGTPQYRLVDRLNCRWPAVCRLAAHALEQSGFVDIRIGPPVDTFGGAGGESKARLFEVFSYAFVAHRPK